MDVWKSSNHMIYLGADHGGFELREKIKKWLPEWNYKYQDMGNEKLEEGDDYPAFAFRVAEQVADDERDGKEAFGILICRSAVGMVIAANKIHGARAAAVYNKKMAVKSREHNNSNIIALSGDNLTEDEAKKILKIWLTTPFSAEDRHRRRVEQIKEFERLTGN